VKLGAYHTFYHSGDADKEKEDMTCFAELQEERIVETVRDAREELESAFHIIPSYVATETVEVIIWEQGGKESGIMTKGEESRPWKFIYLRVRWKERPDREYESWKWFCELPHTETRAFGKVCEMVREVLPDYWGDFVEESVEQTNCKAAWFTRWGRRTQKKEERQW